MSIYHLKHLLQFHGQAARPMDAQIEFSLKMKTAEDVAQQDPGIKGVVGVETHHLMGKHPHLIKLLPPRKAGNAAAAMFPVLKSHGQATVGIAEVAAPDGAVARYMPKQIARSYLLPLSVDLHPPAASRDEFHALIAILKPNRAGMASGALMIMRYRKQFPRFFRPQIPLAGNGSARGFGIRCFDNKSYFLTILPDCLE